MTRTKLPSFLALTVILLLNNRTGPGTVRTPHELASTLRKRRKYFSGHRPRINIGHR